MRNAECGARNLKMRHFFQPQNTRTTRKRLIFNHEWTRMDTNQFKCVMRDVEFEEKSLRCLRSLL